MPARAVRQATNDRLRTGTGNNRATINCNGQTQANVLADIARHTIGDAKTDEEILRL